MIFIIYEVKNFAAYNSQSSCWSQSRTRIYAKELVIDWRFVQNKKVCYKIRFNWVLKRRFRVVVRVLVLVTAWFLISGFLRVVTLNSPGGVFAMWEVFPIRQQMTELFMFNYVLFIWWSVDVSTIYL